MPPIRPRRIPTRTRDTLLAEPGSGPAEVAHNGPGVVSDHLEVGVTVGARRAERVTVQGVLALDDLDPGLAADRLGRPRRQGSLGEDRFDLGRLDFGDQVTDVAARQL